LGFLVIDLIVNLVLSKISLTLVNQLMFWSTNLNNGLAHTFQMFLEYCVKTSYPICLQFNALFVIICTTLFSLTISMVFFKCTKNSHLGQITSKKIQCVWLHPTIWILCKKKPKCLWLIFDSCHSTHPWQLYNYILPRWL
jgi:hypothetical protein